MANLDAGVGEATRRHRDQGTKFPWSIVNHVCEVTQGPMIPGPSTASSPWPRGAWATWGTGDLGCKDIGDRGDAGPLGPRLQGSRAPRVYGKPGTRLPWPLDDLGVAGPRPPGALDPSADAPAWSCGRDGNLKPGFQEFMVAGDSLPAWPLVILVSGRSRGSRASRPGVPRRAPASRVAPSGGPVVEAVGGGAGQGGRRHGRPRPGIFREIRRLRRDRPPPPARLRPSSPSTRSAGPGPHRKVLDTPQHDS